MTPEWIQGISQDICDWLNQHHYPGQPYFWKLHVQKFSEVITRRYQEYAASQTASPEQGVDFTRPPLARQIIDASRKAGQPLSGDEKQTTARERAGRFLLSKGHIMGEKIDAGIVQDYLEDAEQRVSDLERKRDEFREALRLVDNSCSRLHHSKKDRHEAMESCPVEARIAALLASEPGKEVKP